MLGKSRFGRTILSAATATAIVSASATGAMAFCFSNDSLSTQNIHVQQLDRSKFLNTMSSTMNKITNGVCKAASVGNKKQGGDLQNCKQIAKAFAGAKEGLKRAGQDMRNDKYMGPPMRAVEDAAEATYDFVYGLPLVGDTVGFARYATMEVTAPFINIGKAAGKEIAKAAKKIASATTDTIDKITSKRFKKTVGPDATQCCNHKNRDCNPSGRKDGKIYFKIKYAGVSRVVKLGATDHMECRVNNKHPKRTVCKNYVFPYSPPHGNGKTVRAQLIKSMDGNKCLEVGGWNKKNGANVNMWKCTGAKNQRWVIYRNGTIRSEMNNKCLDVAVRNVKDAKNGSNVVVSSCHGGSNQRWRNLSRANLLMSNVPGSSNMCLEVGGWNKKNGANVNIWKCKKKQANQRRTVGKTATYPQVLKVRYPGKCVDNTGSTKKGGKVHSWDCNPKNANQQWAFKLLANNYVQIKSRRSGLCLDVAASKKHNGAKVGQWTCHSGANQQWKVHGVKDGWFQLRARHSGKCLDLKGPYKPNRTPFQQWACGNVPQQSFRDAG